jgi:hypothetical protein
LLQQVKASEESEFVVVDLSTFCLYHTFRKGKYAGKAAAEII